MRRVWLLGLALGLVIVLAVATLSVLGGGEDDRPQAELGSGRAAPLRSACADVLVVVADGSGDKPRGKAASGPTTAVLADSYATTVRATGRTVEVRRVGGTPASATTLVAGDRHRPLTQAVSRARIKKWAASIKGTSATATKALLSASRACPAQQLVLVGYGQGAGALHRTLARVGARPAFAPRLVGAVLVADPLRAAATRASRIGTPVAAKKGRGLVTRLGQVADVPAVGAAYPVWSVCTRDDAVCDPGAAPARTALKVHAGYRKGAGAQQLRGVAATLATRTGQWAVPVPREQVLTGRIGQPITLQLSAAVTAGAESSVRWEQITGLPEGITLSETGLLSGTPTGYGTWNITFVVRNSAAPELPGSPGLVTLRVLPGTAGVDAGGQMTCTASSDGSAWCWGRNNFGQAGDGTKAMRPTASQVGLPGAWQYDWQQVSTGGSTSCGVKTNGTLWCWGLNNRGQLGVSGGDRALPVQVGTATTWASVSTGWFHTCAVRTDGSLWCWGVNDRGQVGAGGAKVRRQPARVAAGSTDWSSVSVGGWHTCATKTDGSAWCWGGNGFGQAGQPTDAPVNVPTRVGTDSDWVSLSASWSHTCGLTSAGRIRCWGLGAQGELGNGSAALQRTPVQVPGEQVWTAVSVGEGNTCALDNAGSAWCWGSNRYGQLGTGSQTASLVPVRVAGPAGAASLVSVDAGWFHACGVRSDGTTTCWGNNEYGQIGNGTQTAVPSPQAMTAYDGTLADREEVETLSPAELAEQAVGSRPQVAGQSAARRKQAYSFRITTFNLLGSQHTAPGGSASGFAPGRVRTEWAADLVAAYGSDIVGFSEMQSDQLAAMQAAMAPTGGFAFYPGTALGGPGIPTNVMWRSDVFETTWQSSFKIPFMGGTRPMPIVRLRHRATGQELYVVNIHNSPNDRKGREWERDKAEKIEIATVKRLAKDKLPIMLTGDFNEHGEVFCRITRATKMRSASGGSSSKKSCKPPKNMRVDWIFGSRDVSMADFRLDQGIYVRRITDHAVLSTRVDVP